MVAWTIQPLTENERAWVARFIAERWGSDTMIVHDTAYTISHQPGLVALNAQGERVGLLTYHIESQQCEILSLDSIQPNAGIGTTLLQHAELVARQAGCSRLWLITTNDNLRALGFYQKRGFELIAIHRHAVTQARQRKPQIPLVGEHRIPLRDEIELAKSL